MAAEREQARLRKQAEDALAVQAQLRARAGLADKLSAAGKLFNDGRFDEAEQLFYQIPDPSTAPLLNSLAMTRARNGDWSRATTNFARVITLVPTEHLPYYLLAPLLIETGDLQGYERHRQTILQQFSDVRVPITAERMLKASLLVPLPESGLMGIDKLGKNLESAAPRVLRQDTFRLARGLLAYRQAEYAWALQLLKNIGSGSLPNNSQTAIQACAISAMAQWQLGQKDQARGALARCPPALEEKPAKFKPKDLGATWTDYLISEILRKEATALLSGQTDPDASGP